MKTNTDLNAKYIAVLGYNEPSLVFELGSDLKIFKNVENLEKKAFLYEYFIIEKNYYNSFNEIVNKTKVGYNLIKKIKGFNASKGKWVELYIIKK